MPCYKPITAWRGKEESARGKFPLVFESRKAQQPDQDLKIACGQCIGCRLEKARQWATRCMHEAQMHEENSFITLTFNEEELWKRENPGTIDIRDWQLFAKKMRKRYENKIRYYQCGEYGDQSGRPHYHAILFGHDWADKKIHSIHNNNRLYTSDELDSIWGKGYCLIGEVTFDSAGYVARYCTKKITGDSAKDHYRWCDDNGEVHDRVPEFSSMSRRPGIGLTWYQKYREDCYPSDWISVRGKKCKPPKYYDRQLEVDRPYDYELITEKRKEESRIAKVEPLERLLIREQCKKNQIQTLKRKI